MRRFSGVPTNSALSILDGNYTIAASVDSFSSKVCDLTVTDTRLPDDDSNASKSKHLLIGKSADIQIDGKIVNFIFRFIDPANGICAFDVKSR